MSRERDEDVEYDEAVQRLVDARSEGREAGRNEHAVETCPYYPFEAEYAAWHEGRLEGLAQLLTRRAA